MRSPPLRSKAISFGRIYLVFAAGYFLSYLYRTVNAVISPDLTRDLGLHPASLGLLTSVYLLAFGLMQIPAGMLLDRSGRGVSSPRYCRSRRWGRSRSDWPTRCRVSSLRARRSAWASASA